MSRTLIDTGAIYAFVTRNDLHHHEAVNFTRAWVARRNLFVLADMVFFEAMTLVKRRLGSQVAVRVGQELRENPVYLWTVVPPEVESATWKIFQKYQDKEWSYTDCALFALAEELRIPQVFSFDDHFVQMPGIERLPNPRSIRSKSTNSVSHRKH